MNHRRSLMLTAAKISADLCAKKFHAVKLIDREERVFVDGLGLIFPGRRGNVCQPVDEALIDRAIAIIERLPRLAAPGQLHTGDVKVFIELASGYVCNGSVIVACHRLGIPMAYDGTFPRIAIPKRAVIRSDGGYCSLPAATIRCDSAGSIAGDLR